MSLSINARLQRGYQLSRRLRRFAQNERALRSRWGAPTRLGMDLLADGFHRDKLGLYPGIEDPAIRAAYVNDITALRVRMFNGKSGDLLTQKEILLTVLQHHLGWRLDYRVVDIPMDHPSPHAFLADRLGTATDGPLALLPRLDTVSARVVDGDRLTDPSFDLCMRCLLLWLSPQLRGPRLSSRPAHRIPGGHGASPVQSDALRQAVHDPLIVQFGTYWDATQPFLGHLVALRGGGVNAGWPQLAPGLEVDQLDHQQGEPMVGVRIGTDRQGRMLRFVRRPGLPVPQAAVRRTAGELLRAARRFPNLRAINWNFLVADDDLVFVDAENRLDVVYPQLFGPLLADPRLHAAYVDAGMRERGRSRP